MPRICCLGLRSDSLLVHTHESQQPWEEDHDRRKRRQSYRLDTIVLIHGFWMTLSWEKRSSTMRARATVC